LELAAKKGEPPFANPISAFRKNVALGWTRVAVAGRTTFSAAEVMEKVRSAEKRRFDAEAN
jgi:hypothetical protein